VLLAEEANPVDHLLSAIARRFEAGVETSVLALQELYPLGRDHAFDSRRLETLEACLRLQRPPSKGRQLVTEMLHQLIQLREGGDFRTCAV
jgi:hypothetical protein